MRRNWKPGRGYHTAIRNTSWWRNNHDGTITGVVVMTMWPTDEPFTEDTVPEYELWTVRLPLEPYHPFRAPAWMPDRIGRSRLMPWRRRNGWLQPGPIYMLCDKPHRVTSWEEGNPRRQVLDRTPLPGKLAARVAADLGPVRVPRRVYDAWRTTADAVRLAAQSKKES